MDYQTADTPAAEDRSDAILADALAAERQAADPSAYPGVLEIAASLGVGAVVVVLGYASWASGATIPLLWVVDFGIHEFGHLVTFWAPWRVTAAAGSVFQVAVPLGVAAYAWYARKRWDIAAIFVAWAGCSARSVAVYIADAPYQHLMLWGGEGVLHDWAQLLAGRSMLYAGTIASAVEVTAWLLVGTGFALALAPVVMRSVTAFRIRTHAAAIEARRATLPVREPHRPIG